MPASSPLRPAAARGPEPPVTMLTVMMWFSASMVSGPSGPSQDLVDALAAESPTSFVTRTVLKLALCTVLASCGNYVLGYVLPFLRFVSQIPW